MVAVGVAIGLGALEASDDYAFFEPETFAIDGEPARWRDSKALDRKVLGLQPGMSVDAVRSRLGMQAYGAAEEDSIALFYGSWQLTFGFSGLDTRTRDYGHRRWADYQLLDSKIRRLRLGSSIKAVKSKLGRPEALEVYATVPEQDIALVYGPWTLDFTNERLEGRYPSW